MNGPYGDPASPLSGQPAPASTQAAMTDVLIPPSRNTGRPWRYLIGYTHSTGADNWYWESATPYTDLNDTNAVISAIEQRWPQRISVGLSGFTQLCGPEPIALRVPTATHPSRETNPYRYLTFWYGRGAAGTFGFNMHHTDTDHPITTFDMIDHIQPLVGPDLGLTRWARLLSFTLIAGPANS